MATVADLRQLVGDDAEPFELSDVDIARALVQAQMRLYEGAVILRTLLESRSADDFGPAWRERTAELRKRAVGTWVNGVSTADRTLVDLDAETAVGVALIKAQVDAWALKDDDSAIPADKLGLAPAEQGSMAHPRLLVGRHDLNDLTDPGVFILPALDPEDGEHQNVPAVVRGGEAFTLIVWRVGDDDDDQAVRQAYLSVPTDTGGVTLVERWERTADFVGHSFEAWVKTNPAVDWAQIGSTDIIPANRLPTPHQEAGISEAAAKALILATVDQWAHEGDVSAIPKEKLTRAFDAISSHFPDWAFKDNVSTIPYAKLPPGIGTAGNLSDPIPATGTGDFDLNAQGTGWYRIDGTLNVVNGPDYHWTGNPPGSFWLRSITVSEENDSQGQSINSVHQVFLVEGQWYWRHKGDGAWTDWREVGDSATWARAGNTDQIPADKLQNAPAGAGGGLTQAQVDARIRTLTEDWAEKGNVEGIPGAKLSNAWAIIEPFVQDYAQVGNGAIVPTDKLGNVRTYIADWAEAGNTTQIPAAKLRNAPSGGGQTADQVKALIRDGVQNWAEVGNLDDIPSGKLQAAHAWIADFAETGRDVAIPVSKDVPPIKRIDGELNLNTARTSTDATLFSEAADQIVVMKPSNRVGEEPQVFVEVDPPAGWQCICLVTRPTRIGPAQAVTSTTIEGFPLLPQTSLPTADIPAGSLFRISAKSGGGVLFTNLVPEVATWADKGNTEPIPAAKLSLVKPFLGYSNENTTLKFRYSPDPNPTDHVLNYAELRDQIVVVDGHRNILQINEPPYAGIRFYAWVLSDGCTWATDATANIYEGGATTTIPAGSFYMVTERQVSGARHAVITRLFTSPGDAVADWAEAGNSDKIPAAKLPIPIDFQSVNVADNGRVNFRTAKGGASVGLQVTWTEVDGKALVIDADNVTIYCPDSPAVGQRCHLWVIGTGCRFVPAETDDFSFENGAATSIPAGSVYELSVRAAAGPQPTVVTRLFYSPPRPSTIGSLNCGTQAVGGSGQNVLSDAIQQKLYAGWADAANYTEIALVMESGPGTTRAQQVVVLPLTGITARPPTGENTINLDSGTGGFDPTQLRPNAIRLACIGPTVATESDRNQVTLWSQRAFPAGWTCRVELRKLVV